MREEKRYSNIYIKQIANIKMKIRDEIDIKMN